MKICWNTYILVLLICILTLFPNIAEYIIPDDCLHWSIGVLLLFLLFIHFTFLFWTSRIDSIRNIISYMSIIVFCCSLLSIYGVLQYVQLMPLISYVGISGGFSNPAGYAASLCMGIPAALLLLRYYHQKKIFYFSLLVILFIICVGIIMSGSRTGILCMAVIFTIRYCFDKRKRLKIKWLGWIGICLPIALIVLYYYKPISANGRLFIWRCSWEMIKDKPLLGYVTGGFLANYMNYQADFFTHHPESEYIMLADDVQHPFNEYILLLVDYGIIGFILFLFLAFLLWRIFRQNPSLLNNCAFSCLMGIAVFACFSYPLSYPFVWIMGGGSCCILFSSANWNRYMSVSWKKSIRFFFIYCSLMGITYSIWKIDNLKEWKKVSQVALEKQTDETFCEFEKLYPNLQNNRLFLYNYAAELNYGGYYEESQRIAAKCSQVWADYQLQLLMGNNSINLLHYKEAEIHFRLAYNMCPVRFVPLYELMLLYQETGERERAVKIAKEICKKKIKVDSNKVKFIRHEAFKLINGYMLSGFELPHK